MTISELIKSYPEHKLVRFEYAYLNRDLKPETDPDRSYTGQPSGFLTEMERKDPSIPHLYACCGEANDFEIISESEDEICLRYTDFR